ncbi:MAG: hypothetical protein GQ542_13515 [Desulforhopalus sp.]|nr:hypothetical protein [Desulforhopalus sp.]
MNTVIVSCSSCSKKNRIPPDKQYLLPKCGHCQAPVNMTNHGVPIDLAIFAHPPISSNLFSHAEAALIAQG